MTKTITIKGGLGNQLFQYAHGLKLSLVDKKNIKYDISFFENTKKNSNRPFLLNKFNIDTKAQFENIKNSNSEIQQKMLLKDEEIKKCFATIQSLKSTMVDL